MRNRHADYNGQSPAFLPRSRPSFMWGPYQWSGQPWRHWNLVSPNQETCVSLLILYFNVPLFDCCKVSVIISDFKFNLSPTLWLKLWLLNSYLSIKPFKSDFKFNLSPTLWWLLPLVVADSTSFFYDTKLNIKNFVIEALIVGVKFFSRRYFFHCFYLLYLINSKISTFVDRSSISCIYIERFCDSFCVLESRYIS